MTDGYVALSGLCAVLCCAKCERGSVDVILLWSVVLSYNRSLADVQPIVLFSVVEWMYVVLE